MPTRFIRPRAIAACLLAAVVVGAAWGWHARRAPDEFPSLSPLAQRALRDTATRVHAAPGAHVVVYAADPRTAAVMRDEADYALVEIARRVGVKTPTSTVHILLIPGTGSWDKLARQKGFRPDSLALNVGNEILLRDDPDQRMRADRLAHELVHVVLREAYGPGIPLWLDEGLAGYLGFAVSRAYRAARGTRMGGAWPGVSTAGMESLDGLTSRTRLPEDTDSAMVVYRASEELVAWIEDRLGATRMRSFVAAVATGAPWRAELEKYLNGSHFSIVELEHAIRQAVESPKKR